LKELERLEGILKTQPDANDPFPWSDQRLLDNKLTIN
jgi:hypothetical protein